MSARLAHILQMGAALVAIVLGASQLGLPIIPDRMLPAPMRPSRTWWFGKALGWPQPKNLQSPPERRIDTHGIRQTGPDGTRLLNHEGSW